MTCRALCGVIQARFKGEIHPINEPRGPSCCSSGRDVEMIPVQLERRKDVRVCVSEYHRK